MKVSFRVFSALALTILGFIFAAPAVAQERLEVAVASTTPDVVGEMLVSAFRDKLATSPRYALAPAGGGAYAGMVITTMAGDNNNTGGTYTLYSVVYTLKNSPRSPFPLAAFPLYLTSGVGTCGAYRVKECATMLYSDMDSTLGPWVSVLLALQKQAQAAKPTK